MNQDKINEYGALAESEENPHVLARALGRTLGDYVQLRETALEGLNRLEGYAERGIDCLPRGFDASDFIRIQESIKKFRERLLAV